MSARCSIVYELLIASSTFGPRRLKRIGGWNRKKGPPPIATTNLAIKQISGSATTEFWKIAAENKKTAASSGLLYSGKLNDNR
jgi:hypothetical protein